MGSRRVCESNAPVSTASVFFRSRLLGCSLLATLAGAALPYICAAPPSPAPDPPARKIPAIPHRLASPEIGKRSALLLSPTLIELTVITGGGPVLPPEKGPAPEFPPPVLGPDEFRVSVAGEHHAPVRVGFRRRPVYAPLKQRDLRIGQYIYLELTQPIKAHAAVEVTYQGKTVPWLAGFREATNAHPQRLNPAIHVNQVGYLPNAPKVAQVGYFLGSLGELRLPGEEPGAPPSPPAGTGGRLEPTAAGGLEFHLIGAATGAIVHRGKLRRRPDRGMPHGTYQNVWDADFSAFQRPGEYRLSVPGLGASYPFFIDEGTAAAFARTSALGLYHQRCGAENALPYSRFTHAACHLAPATVPAGPIRALLGLEDTAPDADLFPMVRRGPVDVSGGHHDAGDYSKYTINSAAFIHHLVFAVDAMKGVAEIDNLGLPESGDGISDLLQIAKWESDFLVKMQDDDGGFHFLVYPRERRYEQDVLPDRGDPQIVWPKNSAATAAAVAALAQTASSKSLQTHYPADSKRYLAAARKGWQFLRAAQARFDGEIYRKFTHYGDDFKDADELVWAAVELYAATGEPEFETQVRERLNPSDSGTRRWGWRRMNESYGRAIRSYAFALRTGRLTRAQLDARLLTQCEEEIIACADDWLKASEESAYGVSYPAQTKRVGGGGWFFPPDYTYDLAVAAQLDFPRKADRRPDYFKAILANLNYEAGSNPVNVSFLTGLGWKRPLEIVHQFAQNDRRTLPPSGIPLGTIQEGFHYMENYRRELGALCYPLDGAKDSPYPILDRWGDSFNLQTEFVIINQARALAVSSWLLGQTSLKDQTWKPTTARITGVPAPSVSVGQPLNVRLEPPAGLDLREARVVWEGSLHASAFGESYLYTPKQPGPQWIEAEAQWPDGRRAFGVITFTATASP